MNKTRRKDLDSLKDTLDGIKGDLLSVGELLEDFGEEIETCMEEEEESFDRLPEGLQDSKRGEKMQDAIKYMSEAIDEVGFIARKIKEVSGWFAEVNVLLENAKVLK